MIIRMLTNIHASMAYNKVQIKKNYNQNHSNQVEYTYHKNSSMINLSINLILIP